LSTPEALFSVFLNGFENKSYPLQITKSTIVEEFVESVSKLLNIPKQYLSFTTNGKSLSINSKEKKLTDYNVRDNTIIHVISTFKGGEQ